MIGVDFAYVLAGLIFAAIAIASATDGDNSKRWNNTAFWGLLAVSFLAGDALGDFANGLLVIAMVVIGGFGGIGVTRPATTSAIERETGATRLGWRLFAPILVVPAVALTGTLALKGVRVGATPLVDPAQVTVIATALGAVLALALALVLVRCSPAAAVHEARRLMDQVGWAAILPQLLAALGAVFALAGVGGAVGHLLGDWLPMTSPFMAVTAYCLGMTVFTMIMGNAFAAFPVMTAGVGAPLIVGRFGGDPAIMGALGMLAGYCGTLMTPMASHNIVPTALLELPAGAVIRVQAPTALIVLAAIVTTMDLTVFRY